MIQSGAPLQPRSSSLFHPVRVSVVQMYGEGGRDDFAGSFMRFDILSYTLCKFRNQFLVQKIRRSHKVEFSIDQLCSLSVRKIPVVIGCTAWFLR